MNFSIFKKRSIRLLLIVLCATACTKESLNTGRERFVGTWTGDAVEDYKLNSTSVLRYNQGFILQLKADGTGFRTLPWYKDTIEWFYQENPTRIAILIPYPIGSGKQAESFSITKDTEIEQIWFSDTPCDIKDSTNTKTFANRVEKTWKLNQ
jgi:hypothetical protein